MLGREPGVLSVEANPVAQTATVTLRRRTLDDVLVAVAIGAGWLYLRVMTLIGGGDVFNEAAAMLAVFVLLGPLVRDASLGNSGRSASGRPAG